MTGAGQPHTTGQSDDPRDQAHVIARELALLARSGVGGPAVREGAIAQALLDFAATQLRDAAEAHRRAWPTKDWRELRDRAAALTQEAAP